ncbi:LacI family DNA-binding transcriptional regulator [Vagococcus acidifermentans]|uniref:LacI family transcriptional regulator n=1 Tax=Vagococcus acidifermentans TaxID=564710 RepID=A0A430B302_9ENTE|nr:LacI family DNA-binding transcriptional regulator [Vagococcus acidifermentans]RSU14688.1 LacI family transcriptional regulator [Vagococcus acidifermentans]
MKQVSMQDIADHLGISRNSVSQALRDKDGVSEETKKAVIKTAHLLGYEYESKTKDKGKLLLMATEFAFSQTSFFGKIVASVKKHCEINKFSLDTCTLSADMIDKLLLPQNLSDYAGVLIMSHSSNEYINAVIASKIPTVLIDHHDPSLLSDAILSKNTDGAYLAVSLLLKNKHKRIGFIGDTAFSPSYLERYRGYKRALEDSHITRDKNIEITEIEESQGALFNSLKNVQSMPEAWFCVNSGLAFMLNSYLQSEGYIIPDDISIICFDDTEFTRMAQPTLSNVATDLSYMGELAVSTMIDRIKFPKKPFVHKQILPALNILESTKLVP